MKKLTKWYKSRLAWFDDNLVHAALIGFIILSSLVPKIPFQFVEYTYIRIRYDDIFPVLLIIIFVIQWLRKKVKLNTKFLIPVLIFWTSVFVSFVWGYFFQNTIPIKNIGLLHSLRRIQYISIFFVASSVTTSKGKFMQYMRVYFWTLFVVVLYGIGQRFLQFPSVQSMNPAYVDGRLLILSPNDRINSTFGGHFDLAAYLTFSIPMLIGFYFNFNRISYFLLYVIALITLLYTAARSSFIAYIVSISSLLLYFKKYKIFVMVILITISLLLVTGEMTKRFQQTFQMKTIYVNEQTGTINIQQRYDTTKELPAGTFKIPLTKNKNINVDESQLNQAALDQAIQEAKNKGRKINTAEIQKRASELAKYIQPQKTILCDIACSTRLQAEWPRAIAAFLYNPLVGTGPSSITEATDNDFLRWLGETGLFGTTSFLILLSMIGKKIWRYGKGLDSDEKYIYFGFVFGTIALLLNALYIDVFEASKIAYNFWIVAGCFIGFITSQLLTKENGRKAK